MSDTIPRRQVEWQDSFGNVDLDPLYEEYLEDQAEREKIEENKAE